MKKEEILEKIEELENMLYEIDEEQEKLEDIRKNARLAAKTTKIMMEEYKKEGLEEELALELLKIGLGGNK